MEILRYIMYLAMILITGNEMWKANGERNLGFTIFWAFISALLIIMGSIKLST